MKYQDINAKTIDSWCLQGWIWGKPLSHEDYLKAESGHFEVYLTPTKPVPSEWFGVLEGKKILGLASGGGQQLPVFSAFGAECTLLDYSEVQCETEKKVAERENYKITVIRADMTQRLPFENESFDIVFYPVSNCYIENPEPVFSECFRILKTGGILLCGLDNGINFIFDETETTVKYSLPFNPLKDSELLRNATEKNEGVQFSHTLDEQLGGQLRSGFLITDLYEDTNGTGNLHEHGIPSFIATRAVKPDFDIRKTYG